ncbi:hypothetical protein QNI16_19530 [Cytophagaceae bacterium YF14B1]|uniref:Uncharacterized protein n=1 Tax=Xanthocytophaga flava TaxID=3048013 RepID=A0AAE3U7R7_9BACT|nr:hypothetical protein [Xanthocytophaga flavus]MDJ1482701.1 hypothetical protein [Xanthocytophaga flavus]
MVKTLDEEKGKRYIDIEQVHPETGEVEQYQVGKENKNGSPVSREMKALDDIEQAQGCKRPEFKACNKKITDMNSKQLNFYLLPEELFLINEWLKKNNIYIIRNPIDSLDELYVENLNLYKPEAKARQVYLQLERFSQCIVTRYSEKVNKYFVDGDKSCVIEFSMPVFPDPNQIILSRSRLYCCSRYYDDNVLITKDSDFLDWINKFYNSFKKEFLVKYESDQADWASEKVIKWIEVGGALRV